VSARDGNSGIGCGGALFIVLALAILLGLSGIGSDQVSHDCGEVATCIKSDD